VNVASIPKDLLESELFGHEKGAFTGAVSTRLGKFEEANGGTLFLDEISELDISLQSKLLRVLQEKEVVRVGSNKTIPLNVRIIISTNKSLLAEVKKKNFREDLYYRFLGFTIELPPMRERLSDLGALSDYFIAEFCKENNMKIKTISPKGIEKLMKYNFPGNIRELRAIIELAAALSGDSTNIGEDAIVLEATEETFDVPKEEMSLDDYNRKLILHYLKKYNNKVLVVAEKLGIGKSTIYNLLKSNDKAKKDDESSPELPK
jgi:transcriptional regulator with PAS, ATPase and Fis domain